MSETIHPANLFKAVLVEYLKEFNPAYPSGDPLFQEVEVISEEEMTTLKPAGPDITIFEAQQSEELAEGAGVWRLYLAVTLIMPGDTPEATWRLMEESLWQYLFDTYPTDHASMGDGDLLGPLAGRMNKICLLRNGEDPDEWPRLLCVGDVYSAKRTPPELDSPSARVSMLSFTANAEVMPPGFSPG